MYELGVIANVFTKANETGYNDCIFDSFITDQHSQKIQDQYY